MGGKKSTLMKLMQTQKEHAKSMQMFSLCWFCARGIENIQGKTATRQSGK